MPGNEIDRELVKHEVQIEKLEERMDAVEDRVHRHSNRTQANTNDLAVLKAADMPARLTGLEAWRQRVLGAAAAIGAVFGMLGALAVAVADHLLKKS